MLRTGWEPSHIVYSCISSAIQSKGFTANGDSQQLQICLKYLVTPLKDFHESSSMSYQCPNFRIWMNLDSPHLPTFSVTFHAKNWLWGFCVKLSNSPTGMIGPILGLCHGLYTIQFLNMNPKFLCLQFQHKFSRCYHATTYWTSEPSTDVAIMAVDMELHAIVLHVLWTRFNLRHLECWHACRGLLVLMRPENRRNYHEELKGFNLPPVFF